MWSLFVGQPAPRWLLPGWSGPLWAGLALAAVTFNALRQSLLATHATRPHYDHPHTLVQLLQDGVPIGVHVAVTYEELTEGRGAAGPWLDCFTDTPACLRRLAGSRSDFALMSNSAVLYRNVTAGHRERIRTLDAPFVVQPIVIYFARGHPLAHQVGSL